MRLKVVAIVGLLVVGGIAVFMTVGGLPSSAAATPTYLTSTAAVADVSDDVAATGAIASSKSWALVFGAAAGSTASQSGSPATWLVSAVKVKVGDPVKKGAVLATATNTSLRVSIATATSKVNTATIEVATAQDAYDAATTTAQLRQTKIALLNARDGLAQAKAALTDLNAQLSHASLVAPADGIVTVINLTVGANAPVADAIDLTAATFQVTANVVESDVSTLQIGQPATVTVSAISADLTGSVTAIAPVAEASTSGGVVSYAVTVSLQAPPPSLRPGMTADVTVTTASASGVLAVPAAAIRGTSGNYNVLVLTAAGTAEARPVTVGLMTSSLVEIKSGLNAGDVVITGTASQQRTTTGGQGGNGIVVPGGGGGFGGRGGGN
ncbi:MAG TPA: efflux RND transporter periplasmic adaptor subunit [Candidatus Limnocylindrales bacterium]